MKKILFILSIALVLNANAQYTKLHDFAHAPYGDAPYGSLYYDGTYLYGTTNLGGASSAGMIFKIKPDGTGYIDLLDFTGTNGTNPNGSLISDGTFLYGMTSRGGADGNCGNIFKILPNGTGFDTLHSFKGCNSGTDGYSPYGDLFYDGTFLYGMTFYGGTSSNCTISSSGIYGCGTIFKIKTDGTGYTILLNFNATTNGSAPYGSLISDGTFLYGMTNTGGANNNGTIFKIKPDGTGYVDLFDFNAASNGSYPYGNLYYDGTYLYGMTNRGISHLYGNIFKIKPDGTGYSDLFDLTGTTGETPYGSLISDGTYLYGMTSGGGVHGAGIIFKIIPNGTGYDTLMSFNGATGNEPRGSLLLNNGCLYGMTAGGGANSTGVVFSYCLAGAGIQQFANAKNQVKISPNPFTDYTTISFEQSGAPVTFIMYDMLGKEVQRTEHITTSEIQIQRNSLQSGMYFIKIINNGGVLNTGKVIAE